MTGLDQVFDENHDALRKKLEATLTPQERRELAEAITDRERAVRNERPVDMSLLADTRVAIAILEGPRHVFTFANAAYRALVSGREVVGKALDDALPEVREQGFGALLDQVMATGETFRASEMPVQVATAEGDTTLHLNFDYSAMRDAKGRVFGVLATLTEVTEQVISRQRYRSVFENMDDGFCLIELVKDSTGNYCDYLFLETNQAFDTQTGLKDPVGKTIVQLAPGISKSWFSIYGKVADTGQSTRFENHDPALQRWFDAYASKVDSASGRQVAIIFKDITARKLSELERERLLAELSRSNTALDQFASVASHDLRVPLRGIAMLAEWIEEDLGNALTPGARDKLSLMRGRVKHLHALISGIREYSMAGRRPTGNENIDLTALLGEMLELLAPEETVKFMLPENPPAMRTERVQLQQVLMNLVSNAIKHSQRPDVSIRIGAVREGAFIHFTVSDDGVGIAREFHDRIWDVFQTLEPKEDDSTGIGLSVVKRLAENRGGRVFVDSSEGQGATFHVLWPA